YSRARIGLRFFADDVIAEVDALVANEHRRPRDELADFVLALVAERAVQHFCVGRSLFIRHICFVSLVKMRLPTGPAHSTLTGRHGTASGSVFREPSPRNGMQEPCPPTHTIPHLRPT